MAANDDLRWTRENLAWAAGLFEGEGCIAVSRRANKLHDQWSLVLASTDLDVLKRLQTVVGMGNITGPLGRSDHKPYWTWRVTRREHVYALLVAIYPWLLQRRQDRALECLAAINKQGYGVRRCAQGHLWNRASVVRRPYGGRSRRVCKACLDEGRVEVRLEAVS